MWHILLQKSSVLCYTVGMKREFTLRVVLREKLHENLVRYAERTGLSLSDATRCCLAAVLKEEEGADTEAELTLLIERLIAKRERAREKKAG